ncbi:hypothetical protein K0040_18600 [Terrisporobacter petrolearius]|uniref:hypothetical protein n=1 Tax=Terrisporobacter petrolearius TaxID=1460447 RepID=UPI001D166C6D|nr:hypothetical protein [Terrisporobacter petrolearius]MCC3866261.1 hypothetical protein [Terrisporobacter petrolearius]
MNLADTIFIDVTNKILEEYRKNETIKFEYMNSDILDNVLESFIDRFERESENKI